MDRIGIRELRQNASVWLKRVANGEAFEITDHGNTVAVLQPPPDGDPVDRLIALGRLSSANENLTNAKKPLQPTKGKQLPSALLANMRDDER